MSDDNPLAARLMQVEMAVAHLQRDLGDMHEVLLDLQRDLRGLHRSMGRIEQKVTALEDPAPPRDPLDERPPHY